MISVDDFLNFILEKYSNRIVEAIALNPSPFKLLPFNFPAEVEEKIKKIGISSLYEHQFLALQKLFSGLNVCLVSPTASGKSLVYYLPMIDEYLKDNNSTFLLVFPAKSLAQDQIKNLLQVLPEANPAVYDGDTPQNLRKFIRENSRIIATNPDMLHYGILPNHRHWANFFRNLKIIVVDEMHVYRGAFGSNAAFVFRRLLRIARLYGADPKIILTSATVGNPEEQSEKLFGKKFEVIKTEKLSPFKKTFVFWNPPFDFSRNKRMSSNRDAVYLFRDAVEFGLRTIVFSKSKQAAESIAKQTKEMLEWDLKNKVAVYRAGLLPQKRREIEKKLFSGELLGVSTTPALELGVDIGDLNVAIINRFPGTVSSFFQQAGRVGRKQSSVVVFIAGEDPLDQYYVTHVEELITKPRENAVVDLTNEYIAEKHLLSAAFEFPLKFDDFSTYFEKENLEIANSLLIKGKLRKGKKGFYLTPGNRRPHDEISIRTASPDFYEIIDIDSGELIGTMEGSLAFFYLYPGAIYLQETFTYFVTELDLDKRIAFVKKAEDVQYYTITLEDTDIEIISELKQKKIGNFNVFFGKVRVTNQVIGFNKKHILTDQLLGFQPLDLPPVEFNTQCLWFTLDEKLISSLNLDEGRLAGGIHGIEHAHIALMPYFAGCDRWDIGGMSTPVHSQTEKTTIFIYDGYEGGIGFCEKGFSFFEEHISQTLETISMCPCTGGCPSCIVSPKCGNNNEPLDKDASLKLLKVHLGGVV